MDEENGNQTNPTAPELTFKLEVHGLTSEEVNLVADAATRVCNRALAFTNYVEIFRRGE